MNFMSVSNAQINFQRFIGGIGNDQGVHAVILTGDGGYAVAGVTNVDFCSSRITMPEI